MLVGRNRSYGYTTDKEKAAQTAEFDFFGCRNRKKKKKVNMITQIYISVSMVVLQVEHGLHITNSYTIKIKTLYSVNV